MTDLNLKPNFHTPGLRERHAYTPGDDFYELLIDSHRGLSDAQSELLNARLVLILANHIGDLNVLRQALAAAWPQSAPQSVPAISAPVSAPVSAPSSAPSSANKQRQQSAPQESKR